jgi:hypothetical protein
MFTSFLKFKHLLPTSNNASGIRELPVTRERARQLGEGHKEVGDQQQGDGFHVRI